jgi:hypothetical protein
LFDFSGDEVFAMFFCTVLCAVFLWCWYTPLTSVTSIGGSGPRALLAITPLACLAVLLPVLWWWTSHEVIEDRGYVVLFALGGGAWWGGAYLMAAWFGIHPRDDALERRNRPAAVALAGAMLGVTLCYAGANIGEGATIWMTFGPAVLATAVWAMAWGLLEVLTNVGDAVAIERDAPSAVRLAGFLVATGLILGRSVAGDYESSGRLGEDFAREGWPVLPLVVAAAIVQRWARRRGWLVAFAYVLAAVVHVVLLGPWKHLPKGGRP